MFQPRCRLVSILALLALTSVLAVGCGDDVAVEGSGADGIAGDDIDDLGTVVGDADATGDVAGTDASGTDATGTENIIASWKGSKTLNGTSGRQLCR